MNPNEAGHADCDAFQQWWYDEGSGMAPKDGEETEEHVYRVARIAWMNGAYKARYDIDVRRPNGDIPQPAQRTGF